MGLGVRLLQAALGTAAAGLISGSSWLLYVSGLLLAANAGRAFYLNCTSVPNPPPSTPVPNGKIRICVAGYTHSGPTAKAHYLADMIAKAFPDKYETWYYFDQYAFHAFTQKKFDPVPFPAHLKGHSTSPFVWFETGSNNKIEPIGGSDHFSQWVLKTFPKNAEFVELAKQNWVSIKPYITGKSFHCGEGGRPIPPATCSSS